MSLYRIHIKPRGELGREFTFNYCLKENVLGLGYQTRTDKIVNTWEEFESEARNIHSPKALKNVRTFKDKLKKDDLIWTRSESAEYYLAKVNSEWEYYSNEDAKNADIVNIVRCDIMRVPSISDVPGAVTRAFTFSKSFQSISDKACAIYSQYLWDELNNSQIYKIKSPLGDIFSFLSPEEAEDLVFVYLQTSGWIVVPNSRRANTMRFEYIAKNRKGEVATVQVKTGNSPLDLDNYKELKNVDKIFLFNPRGGFSGESYKNIECISPKFMYQFIEENLTILPANITRWYKIVNKSL